MPNYKTPLVFGKNATLEKHFLVKKSVFINTAIFPPITLEGYRLVNVYLSKTNIMDKSSREVVFSIDSLAEVFGQKRIRIDRMRELTKVLEKMEVTIFTGDKKRKVPKLCRLFSKIEIVKYKDGNYVVMDCSDDICDFLFISKGQQYIYYKLEDINEMTSVFSMRMFELCKQHMYKKTMHTFDVDYLKSYLGLGKGYAKYNTFKSNILEVAKKEITANTPYEFTYSDEIRIKKRVEQVTIKFVEQEKRANNEVKKESISIVKENGCDVPDTKREDSQSICGGLYADITKDFTQEDWAAIHKAIREHFEKNHIMFGNGLDGRTEIDNYLSRCLDYMKDRIEEGREIYNPVGYLIEMISENWDIDKKSKKGKEKKPFHSSNTEETQEFWDGFFDAACNR